MDPEEIAANCKYIPIRSINNALDFIETPKETPVFSCKRNLSKLQKYYSTGGTTAHSRPKLKNTFYLALHRAIYTHDWNKLLYLLKMSPVWEQQDQKLPKMAIYIRALTVLLMYHPSAQAQGLLQDYLHMVCTCRTDQEKKALMKLVLTLPDKVLQKVFNMHKRYKCYEDVEGV